MKAQHCCSDAGMEPASACLPQNWPICAYPCTCTLLPCACRKEDKHKPTAVLLELLGNRFLAQWQPPKRAAHAVLYAATDPTLTGRDAWHIAEQIVNAGLKAVVALRVRGL